MCIRRAEQENIAYPCYELIVYKGEDHFLTIFRAVNCFDSFANGEYHLLFFTTAFPEECVTSPPLFSFRCFSQILLGTA